MNLNLALVHVLHPNLFTQEHGGTTQGHNTDKNVLLEMAVTEQIPSTFIRE